MPGHTRWVGSLPLLRRNNRRNLSITGKHCVWVLVGVVSCDITISLTRRVLHSDGLLQYRVRCRLATTLSTLYRANENMRIRRQKKQDMEALPVRSALLSMFNDSNHCVRMHMIRSVPLLFERLTSLQQLELLREISAVLQEANLVEVVLIGGMASHFSTRRLASTL